ncbi:MAG: DNA double-strand break repair nuclease NurA [Dehalococcoidia bacterium]|nr:DNA double-strand break repair nuclease NurA [Dehalococcoidia bacterium]
MSLDFGQTARQLMAAMGDVAATTRTRRQRFADTLDRALAISPAEAANRTGSAGRRPFIAARTGDEGLLASIPPPEPPTDWSALSVDGSHIDVDRHLPLRCYLINLGGCALTYGSNPDCRLFSEPTLAVGDADLYLRPPDGSLEETPISGPLLGALRTVREVERLADAVDALPPDLPALALLDGTLAFWDLQRGSYPRYVSETLIGERLHAALAQLREASHRGRPVAVAAYTSRPQTTEVAGAVRVCLCGSDATECTRRCSARRSDLAQCDGAAGFDDRELFDALLEPGFRSSLYQSGRVESRFAMGLTVGAEWSHFFYVNSGTEIARVEVPDWVADDRELLAQGHAMLIKQCELGLGYPVVISEAHEQAVVSSHDRAEFRRLAIMLMEQQGLPTPGSAKTVSKRLPWV